MNKSELIESVSADADISKAAGRSMDGVAAFLAAARSHGAESAQ